EPTQASHAAWRRGDQPCVGSDVDRLIAADRLCGVIRIDSVGNATVLLDDPTGHEFAHGGLRDCVTTEKCREPPNYFLYPAVMTACCATQKARDLRIQPRERKRTPPSVRIRRLQHVAVSDRPPRSGQINTTFAVARGPDGHKCDGRGAHGISRGRRCGRIVNDAIRRLTAAGRRPRTRLHRTPLTPATVTVLQGLNVRG